MRTIQIIDDDTNPDMRIITAREGDEELFSFVARDTGEFFPMKGSKLQITTISNGAHTEETNTIYFALGDDCLNLFVKARKVLSRFI